MMKKVLTLGFACALLLGGTVFAARGNRGGGNNTGPTSTNTTNSGTSANRGRGFVTVLTRALSLTAEQQAAVQTLYANLQTSVETLRDQHDTQRDEILALLDQDNPDPTTVGQKVIAAHATVEQIEALHETFIDQVSALLTPTQLATFEDLLARHDGRLPFGFGPGRGPGF